MKTVIALSDGSITSDSTSNARLISFKKGAEVSLNDAQADFLVSCGKAEHKKEEIVEVKTTTRKTKKA
ncbi:MAG: hypothetical protein OQL19_11710 [Gammaproteobacteria bacterium]|nr:hypothetical protein [Gammaproteobacteria bacterium]